MTVPTLEEVVGWSAAIGGGLAIAVGVFFIICALFGIEWESARK